MEELAKSKALIYVVEDSQASGALYVSQFTNAGYSARHFSDGHSALVAIKDCMPDVILQDVCLPDISGLEVLRFVEQQASSAKVIMITSNSSIDVAVDAMRLGGFDFIEKPFSSERMLSSAKAALRQKDLDRVSPEATNTITGQPQQQSFLGESLAMQTVFRLLQSAARSKASVFITGESGTGKEMCAQTLHQSGERCQGPFIAINCAAIPAELFESEFFGHVKGAFSGALSDRKGAVEVAHGGTLFLDEICEMELNLQAKLLRFLQSGTFSRVGSNELQQSDVRVVCATNRNPAAEVGEGRFREDLFYRLNVIPVQLPALRERDDDILLLANHVLFEKAANNNKSFRAFSPEVINLFRQYDWPGNIRELQNVVEHMVVIHNGDLITLAMLPKNFSVGVSEPSVHNTTAENKSLPLGEMRPQDIQPLSVVERRTIEAAIDSCAGNIPLAAAYLGISASTIYRKMKSW